MLQKPANIRSAVLLLSGAALLSLVFLQGCGGGDDRDGGATSITVSRVSPIYGNNTGAVTVTITGTSFRSGLTAALTSTNYAEIAAQSVTVGSETQAAATFNLAGATVGVRNVVLRSTDGKSATLPDAFKVTKPTTLYVGEGYARALVVIEAADTASGAAVRQRTITYGQYPTDPFLDTRRDILYCSAWNQWAFLIWNNGSAVNGATAPKVAWSASDQREVRNIFVDVENDYLYVPNCDYSGSADSVDVYHAASGLRAGSNTSTRRITGSGIVAPTAVFLDKANNRLYVANGSQSGCNIAVFDSASSINGSVAPARTISSAELSPYLYDVVLDPSRNILYAGKSGTAGLLVYKNAATINGVVTPDVVVSSASAIYGLWLDGQKDVLFATINGGTSSPGSGSIMVFENASQLTAASTPTRTITNLTGPLGLWGTSD